MIYVGSQRLHPEVMKTYDYLCNMREAVKETPAGHYFFPDQVHRLIRDHDFIWDQIYQLVKARLRAAGYDRRRGDAFRFTLEDDENVIHFGYERGDIEIQGSAGF